MAGEIDQEAGILAQRGAVFGESGKDVRASGLGITQELGFEAVLGAQHHFHGLSVIDGGTQVPARHGGIAIYADDQCEERSLRAWRSLRLVRKHKASRRRSARGRVRRGWRFISAVAMPQLLGNVSASGGPQNRSRRIRYVQDHCVPVVPAYFVSSVSFLPSRNSFLPSSLSAIASWMRTIPTFVAADALFTGPRCTALPLYASTISLVMLVP